MAIAYPLALPAAPGFVDIRFRPRTVVGFAEAPLTLSGQPQVWPGQGWGFTATLPKMTVANADNWVSFLLALNGRQGTFRCGDMSRPTTRGSASGAWTVGAGATFLSTSINLTGTGSLAKGDWFQVGNYLHKVIQVNSPTSYDVWPRLRASYANGTAITYTNALGLFRLASNEMMWDVDVIKHSQMQIEAVEAFA
jgi:hypothetical protein